MESFFNYKIEQFVIESHDGKSSTDLTQCIASVKYYEDLFSPAIFISLVLVNTNGLLSSLINSDSNKQSGIKGGERVRLKINQPAFTFYVAEFIAKLKNLAIEDVIDQTTKNFHKIFKNTKIIE